jgi:hypothetical protein
MDSVLFGVAITKYHRPGIFQQQNFTSCSSEGQKPKIREALWLVSKEGPVPGCRLLISCVLALLKDNETWEVSLWSLVKALIPCKRVPFLWPIHFCEAQSLSTITMWVRISTYELRKGEPYTNIQSVTFNLAKMSVLSNLIYRLKTILVNQQVILWIINW